VTVASQVFVCRGPDCMSRGGQDVYTEMATVVHQEGLSDSVVQTVCGCVAPLCGQGPVVCVYPSGTWYAGVTPGDVAEIVRHDVADGQPVERIVAARLGQ
jgi:(2Fe-2S) ferredoxin